MAGPNIYHEQQADLSAGILFALPFLFLAGGMYRTFLLERAVLLDHTGIVLLAAAAVSLPVHEALHGLGWKLGGRFGRGQVSRYSAMECPCVHAERCCRYGRT